MIGPKALLVQTALVVFTLVLGVVLVRIGAKGARTNKFGYLLVIVALFVMFMFTVPFVAQIRTFTFLRGLQPSNVHSISIDDQVLAADQIVAVTRAFQSAQWFTTRHGGWGKEIPLEIRARSGKVVRLYIARYPSNGSGAVIRGHLGGARGYLTYSCCFLATGETIPQLPATGTQQ